MTDHTHTRHNHAPPDRISKRACHARLQLPTSLELPQLLPLTLLPAPGPGGQHPMAGEHESSKACPFGLRLDLLWATSAPEQLVMLTSIELPA